MSRTLRSFFALSLIAFALPAQATDNPEASPLVAACDALAAQPDNADNPPGLQPFPWATFDGAAALPVCGEALAAFPDHLRTQFHLARANYKLGNLVEAERLYGQAIKQHYPAAYFGLADLLTHSAAPDAGDKWRATVESCIGSGILACQTLLAEALVVGTGGIEPDPAKALPLFEAAAAQGSAFAQSYAGWMFDEGVGVAEDDAKAVSYYLPAAGAGDYFAQNNLAVHYDEGKGVAEDEGLALYWFEKAAAQGDAEDQYIVGGRYLKGIGTAPDFYKAAEWFRRAAAQGDARAAAELEQMIADGLVVPGPAD